MEGSSNLECVIPREDIENCSTCEGFKLYVQESAGHVLNFSCTKLEYEEYNCAAAVCCLRCVRREYYSDPRYDVALLRVYTSLSSMRLEFLPVC